MKAEEEFEQAGMVHHPVCPVEIGVVQDNDGDQAEAPIEPAIIGDLGVIHAVAAVDRGHDEDPVDGKDQHGEQRIANLAPQMAAVRKFGLYFAAAEAVLQQAPQHNKCEARRDEIAQQINDKYFRPYGQRLGDIGETDRHGSSSSVQGSYGLQRTKVGSGGPAVSPKLKKTSPISKSA